MPTLRRAAHRSAREDVRVDHELLFRRLDILSRLITMPLYSLQIGNITSKTFNGLMESSSKTKPMFNRLIGRLPKTKPMFNPTCVPEDSRLASLKVFNIEAEVKLDLVIHRNQQSPDMVAWEVDGAAKRTSRRLLPFERQISAIASRNVRKISLTALGDPDIIAIKTWLKLRDQRELFIVFQNWYWDGQHICLLFEPFEQEDLSEYIERHEIQARSNARAIAIQLLKCLKAMHDSGIYGFELKPQNIFIGSHSPVQVKLCLQELPEMPPRTDSCTLPATDDFSDNREPRLPLGGEKHAQNIWSLGCILYQLLTSEVPFRDVRSSHCHISFRDRGVFSDYFDAKNNHPSKKLLESYASRRATDLVMQLLTIGKLSAYKAQTHTWVKETIGSEHVLPIRYHSFSVNDVQGWRQMTLGSDNVLRPPRPRAGIVSIKRTIVKSIPLSKYFSREREYERDVDTLVKLHESFVKFLGWFEYSDNIHFMMEYPEYGHLGQYLDNNEYKNSDTENTREVRVAVGEITRQILEGLVYSLEIDAKYCDLRPTNVLVFSIFPIRIKLLVNVYWDTETPLHAYMAPELLGLQPATTKQQAASMDSANMWSLGCLVYRIVVGEDLSPRCGNEPHMESVSPTHMQMLKQYCDGQISLPLDKIERPCENREWAQFLKAVLVPSPTSRLSSKEALQSDLFRMVEITNPHRWRVVIEDFKVTHRTGAEKTVWQRIDRLKGGSMGTVSLMETITDRRAERRMVVKGLIKHLSGDQNAGYKRELITLINLKDVTDLFVRFIGWYEDSETIYIAMEHIEDGDLGTYLIRNGASARREAEEITTQLLEGLEFLHEREICHRDLKPQNILVACSSPIRVKLADFGLAKSTHGSRLRTIVGTPNYQAPELVGYLPQPLRRRGPIVYTNALDIWSLGCLVHKILTLKIPFVEVDDDDIIESGLAFVDNDEENINSSLLSDFCHGKIEFPTDSLHQAKVSDNGINFIKRLLVPDPKGRMTVNEALSHEWLNAVSYKVLSSTTNDSRIIRCQLASIGVNISQRTADYLAKKVETGAQSKTYLPSSMLRNIDTLRDKARTAGLTVLLKTLLRIRVTYNNDKPTVLEWTLEPMKLV